MKKLYEKLTVHAFTSVVLFALLVPAASASTMAFVRCAATDQSSADTIINTDRADDLIRQVNCSASNGLATNSIASASLAAGTIRLLGNVAPDAQERGGFAVANTRGILEFNFTAEQDSTVTFAADINGLLQPQGSAANTDLFLGIKVSEVGYGIIEDWRLNWDKFDVLNTGGLLSESLSFSTSQIFGGSEYKVQFTLIGTAAGDDGALLDLSNTACFGVNADSGSITLASGVLTNPELSTGCSSPVVPVPAAAWLFGSGLLGLVGVARRKKS